MMGIFKSLLDGSFTFERYLPEPNRLNWSRASGPLIRLLPHELPLRCLSIITEQYDEFCKRSPIRPSELEAMSATEAAEFYATHLDVGVFVQGGDLIISPSEITESAPLAPQHLPADQSERVFHPWTNDAILPALNRAFAKSSNRIFEHRRQP